MWAQYEHNRTKRSLAREPWAVSSHILEKVIDDRRWNDEANVLCAHQVLKRYSDDLRNTHTRTHATPTNEHGTIVTSGRSIESKVPDRP